LQTGGLNKFFDIVIKIYAYIKIMFKVLAIVFLILALVVYSRMTEIEDYQNFNYYPGYGNPVYSGVAVQNSADGAPYYGHGHGTGQGVPERQYY
jgi:hypothetical protein